MPNITITLTDTQMKGLEYCAYSPQEWAENAVTERARIAIDEICILLMTYCNENSIAIAVGKDAQVTQAYDLGIVDAAANIQAALEVEKSE